MDEVKGDTRIEIISDDGSVKRVSRFLLSLKTLFHFVVLIHHYVSIGFGFYIYVNVTEEQMKEPLIYVAKTYFLGFFTVWNFTQLCNNTLKNKSSEKMESERETKIEISENSSRKVSNFKLSLKTCFHLAFLIHHYVASGFGVSVFFSVTEEQLKEPLILTAKTYAPAFFTIWNFSFQTTFLCLALTYDVLQWLDKEGSKFGKRIKYFRDIVFNGLVFPFTCFVHFMFWAVYFIDRELVFPTVYDQILPWWLNHCVHTNIIIVLIVETILTSRRYPADVKVERIFYVFINIFYAVVFYSIYFFAGCWLYGVFGVMNWWQVCLYQCAISLSSYIFYHSAFFFNRLIHAPETTEEITTKTNEDVESKNFKGNGNEMSIACVENIQVGTPKPLKDNYVVQNGSNGEKVNRDKANGDNLNGEKVNEEKLNGKNGVSKINENGHNNDNGKDWRSIEENGNGAESGTFEKSWSTKYRTSRNQFDNSSL